MQGRAAPKKRRLTMANRSTSRSAATGGATCREGCIFGLSKSSKDASAFYFLRKYQSDLKSTGGV